MKATLAIAAIALLVPTTTRAGALTCLTGTDPWVTSDLFQISQVRALVDSSCVCASFDGSLGKTHGNYVSCAKNLITAAVSAGNLSKQCKRTVTAYYSNSTCGQPASKNEQPCVKKTTSGKVTCAVKPAAECTGTACPHATLCVDAADSNRDGLIGVGDSGACRTICGNGIVEIGEECDPPLSRCSELEACTATCTCAPATYGCCSSEGECEHTNPTLCQLTFDSSAFQAGEHCNCDSSTGLCGGSCVAGAPPTPTPGPPPTPCMSFHDNGDGTVSDCAGRMWEKKDQAGGLHDVENRYAWAGTCSVTGALCQTDLPAGQAAVDACRAGTGGDDGAYGCRTCPAGKTCQNANTIWAWLAQLNQANFAGHNDWRIPTVGQDGSQAELERILVSPCPGDGEPCVSAAFNHDCAPGCTVTTCSCTRPYLYWSSTTNVSFTYDAGAVFFLDGTVFSTDKPDFSRVRAVRGGP